jgi:two-component SAPR family response regulator
MKKNLIVFYIDHSLSDIRVFGAVLFEIDNTIQYTSFDTSKKALSHLTSSRNDLPDFIFIDINMPEVTGLQCLEQIRKIKKLDKINVIMYSNDPVKNYHDAARALNAQCLRKSIAFDRTCKDITAILHPKI